MPNDSSIWLVLPMLASLSAAVLAVALTVIAAKRFKPFRSNLPIAIAVTSVVLMTATAVYVPTQWYASREQSRASKHWWQLVEEGDFAGAEKKLLRQLRTQGNYYGRVHANLSPIMINLAQVYSEQGRLEEAEERFLEALELVRFDMTDREHWYFDGLRQTAEFYVDNGDIALAEEYLLEGLEASRAEYGETHGVTIRMLRSLASCNRTQEDYAQAEKYFSELVAILERDRVDLLTPFGSEYADMLVMLGRDREAQSLRCRWAKLEEEGEY